MDQDLKDRIGKLESRVAELEGQLGFIVPQMGQVHAVLLTFKEDATVRLDRIEDKLDEHTGRFDRVERQLEALPRAVAEQIRASEARLLAAIEATRRGS